ncbi:MAG: hypothetical protein KC442_06660, partial [Thermomicrobiales bacterium]|nr:hypothetical protein [Thermomicrobiales bacterium]
LWEPASGATADAESSPLRPPMTGPLPPANADDIRAVVSQDTVVADAGEDVLLSEARLIAEPVRPAGPSHQAPPARAAQGFDPRTALFRAREAHRERTRARDAAARQSESIEPGRHLADEGETGSELPFDAGVAALEALTESTVIETPPEAWEADTPAASDNRPVVYAGEETSPLARWLDEAQAEPVEEEPAHDELTLDKLFTFASEPVPGWFRTDLPRTCRTCRDFRPAVDGGTGWCANRWAFNKALGEPQQLVYEEEATPCASPIGNWWAPVDDVWLVAADVSHHSRPTPLMDRYLPVKTDEKKRS